MEEEKEDDDTIGSVLFVKNLNFDTTDGNLKKVGCLLDQFVMKTVEYFRFCVTAQLISVFWL